MSKKKDKETGDLFAASGEALKDQGISRVMANAGEWPNKAIAIALSYMSERNGCEVTIDPIRNLIEKEIGKPHDGNVWGGLTITLLRRNFIRPVSGKLKSARASNHARQNQKYIVTL